MFYSRMNLMDSVNVISQNMMMFHQFCLCIILTILLSVCFLSLICIKKKKMPVKILYNASMVELTWTVLPMFFLFSLSSPCFYMLYSIESEKNPYLTFKVLSHQWHWTYESDTPMTNFYFDQYMKELNELNISEPRLLSADDTVVFPYSLYVRLMITSTDVIHSWAMPKMAVKVDAIPSRLNQLIIKSNTPSSFFSQCSEICGINHSFMPIHVEFVNWMDFELCMMITLWEDNEYESISKESMLDLYKKKITNM